MIIPRRPPWYYHRDRPCDEPFLLGWYHALDIDTDYGDGAWVDFKRGLFQKYGYVDDIVRSESVEFTPHEWNAVLQAQWAEIITLDWRHALRARVADLVPEKAQVRRAGVDIVQVYLPVFRADRLQTLGDLK